jgi:hypothetical protein
MAENGGLSQLCALCGFELAIVRDKDAVGTEIHFVLIEYLQLVVIWDHDDDGPN